MTLLVRPQPQGHVLLSHSPDRSLDACPTVALKVSGKEWAAWIAAIKAGYLDSTIPEQERAA